MPQTHEYLVDLYESGLHPGNRPVGLGPVRKGDRFVGTLVRNGEKSVSFDSVVEIKFHHICIAYKTYTKTKIKSFPIHFVKIFSSDEAGGFLSLLCGGRVYTWKMKEPTSVSVFLEAMKREAGDPRPHGQANVAVLHKGAQSANLVPHSRGVPGAKLCELGEVQFPNNSSVTQSDPSVVVEKSGAIRDVMSMIERITKKESRDFVLEAAPEMVTRYCYNWNKKEWAEEVIRIQLDRAPFAEGSMRLAYRMVDESKPKGQRSYVAKVLKENATDEAYFVDVEMQAACQELANAYNANNPPKKIRFLDVYVLRRYHEDGSTSLLVAEPYLDCQKYKKFNNNFGYVGPKDRNTPHAFSHFTYEYTRGKMIVVDVQGVGEVFTDPQIHTADGVGFGQGNWGQEGIKKFFETHICNKICCTLGLGQHAHLAPLAAKAKGLDMGAVRKAPVQRFRAEFHESKFSRNLVPIAGSAYAEDLALFGLTVDQFNHLCYCYQRWCNADYVLLTTYLPHLLGDLGKSTEEKNVQEVKASLDEHRQGRIQFMDLVKWYADAS